MGAVRNEVHGRAAPVSQPIEPETCNRDTSEVR